MGGKSSKQTPQAAAATTATNTTPTAIITDIEQLKQINIFTARLKTLEDESIAANLITTYMVPSFPGAKKDEEVTKAVDALKYFQEWLNFHRAVNSLLVRTAAIPGDRTKVMSGDKVSEELKKHIMDMRQDANANDPSHYQSGPQRTPILYDLNALLTSLEKST